MSDDVTAVAPPTPCDVTAVHPQDEAGASEARPGLVETARAGATKLPLSAADMAALAEDLKAFCADWAERLTGEKLDRQAATPEQARKWALTLVTVYEAVREAGREQQDHAIRVAKFFKANNGHLAKATGLTVAGSRKRALPKASRGAA